MTADSAIRRHLGRYMTEVRQDSGILQREIAAELGVTRYAVSCWENGRRAVPLEAFIRWCTFLHITPGDTLTHVLAKTRRTTS